MDSRSSLCFSVDLFEDFIAQSPLFLPSSFGGLMLGKWEAQIGVLGFTKIKKWSVSDVQSLRMLLSDGECRNSDGIGH